MRNYITIQHIQAQLNNGREVQMQKAKSASKQNISIQAKHSSTFHIYNISIITDKQKNAVDPLTIFHYCSTINVTVKPLVK